MTEETEVVEETATTEDVTSLSDMFEELEAEETTKVETKAEDEKGEVEEPETEEVEAKADDTGKTETETTAEPPSAEQGQMAALLAERQKRQAAETKLAELEAKAQETIPDPIEDPEGYSKHLSDNNAKSALNTRIELSREIMVETDPDYIELEKVFMGLVTDSEGNVIDASLLQQFQNDKFPARFARDHAKAHREMQKLKDPKYRETLKAEVRAEVLAEIQKESKKGVSAVDMPDLTTSTASGSNSGPVEKPLTLEGMFEE